MSKTRIFVSSTCYDLSAVREDLRAHLVALGHEPLLSEYPSFPIDPDDTTVGNCKRNVQQNTDILLLIVGGCRGSLDSATGKSVTNIEYDAARQQGIPCFVFYAVLCSCCCQCGRRTPLPISAQQLTIQMYLTLSRESAPKIAGPSRSKKPAISKRRLLCSCLQCCANSSLEVAQARSIRSLVMPRSPRKRSESLVKNRSIGSFC